MMGIVSHDIPTTKYVPRKFPDHFMADWRESGGS